MKKGIILLIQSIAIVAAFIWWLSAMDIISFLALLTATAAFLLTLFFTKKKKQSSSGDKFSQKAGKNSKQYMSKGDMKIGKD
jgi:membrane protein implicated in regulation of membrane protease activity